MTKLWLTADEHLRPLWIFPPYLIPQDVAHCWYAEVDARNLRDSDIWMTHLLIDGCMVVTCTRTLLMLRWSCPHFTYHMAHSMALKLAVSLSYSQQVTANFDYFQSKSGGLGWRLLPVDCESDGRAETVVDQSLISVIVRWGGCVWAKTMACLVSLTQKTSLHSLGL